MTTSRSSSRRKTRLRVDPKLKVELTISTDKKEHTLCCPYCDRSLRRIQPASLKRPRGFLCKDCKRTFTLVVEYAGRGTKRKERTREGAPEAPDEEPKEE